MRFTPFLKSKSCVWPQAIDITTLSLLSCKIPELYLSYDYSSRHYKIQHNKFYS